MHDLRILSAINKSQDGEALVVWMQRNHAVLEDLKWGFTDALNALLVLAYRQSEDADGLENDLHYAMRQVQEALRAVQHEDNWPTRKKEVV